MKRSLSLALLGVVSRRPDLVVSGINQGPNLGHDITYSGTLAAAMEATVYGVPAIAVSQDERQGWAGNPDFAAQVVAMLAREVLAHGLPLGCFLNVNFPALPPEQVQGIQITRLGRRIYRDVLIKRLDPKGQPYYWIGGDPPDGESEEGTDIGALARGYISVTPLNLDMTDHVQLRVLAGWNLSLSSVEKAGGMVVATASETAP